jgi:hypothetical protein
MRALTGGDSGERDYALSIGGWEGMRIQLTS